MDITIVVVAAAVMAAHLLTLVDAPIPTPMDVLILTPVDAPTAAVTTIQLVKMMTNYKQNHVLNCLYITVPVYIEKSIVFY
jgi:hypothetical protein